MLFGWPPINLLHIDICNHAGNLFPILFQVRQYVKNTILLEGGVFNNWQKKCEFEPYKEKLVADYPDFEWVTLPFNDHNAITIGSRRYDGSTLQVEY